MASVRQLKITPFWHSIVFLIYLTMLIVQEVGFFMERSAYADRFGRTRMNANNLFAAPFVWKFYTRWVHFLTFLLYGFMVCGDLKTSCQRKPTSDNLSEESKQPTRDSLTATCDTVFVAFAFPQAMLICVAYWYMFWTMSKDDENELSQTFWIVNHGAHILPLPVVFVELLLVYHQRPSLVKGLLVALAPGLIYVVFISIYGQLTGVWPYPPLQGSQLNSAFTTLIGKIGSSWRFPSKT